ncbi:MAG: response regulator transcription factor, partial [bacterium]
FQALSHCGFAVDKVKNGAAADSALGATSFDLAILDIGLPGMDGLEVLKRLRARGKRLPVLILTARDGLDDRVAGLDLGADDYITKPFGFMELLARAEAVLRRSRSPAAALPLESYRFGDVAIDFRRHEAHKGSEAIDLSPREFQLLAYFIQHRGEIVTRETLLDTVWDYNAIPFTRTVDMHIAKLRKKVEDNPADPKHVITVHRLGYKFTG